MLNILIFFLLLSILILVHEIGHFIAAKRMGVKVEEFGIGFPPRILWIKYKETIYSLNVIPLGGFVKLYGEEYISLSKADKKKPAVVKMLKSAFSYKKPWQKFFIVIGGVIGNFLFGWLLISFLLTQGIPSPAGYIIVEGVKKDSPAALAGLKKGDHLVEIKIANQSLKLNSTTDLITITKKHAGKPIIFVVRRNGVFFEKKITPRLNPPKGEGPVGIVISSFIEKKYSWYQAPFFGLVEAFKITKLIITELFKALLQLITLQKPKIEISGPVGIASYTSSAIKFGKNALLELAALLSLNLAVVNILPFPALDGGRLVFVLYEWIKKKRVNQNVEKYANMAGIIILLSLAALITYFDIIKLIGK